jgi:predicted phosphate transport protein (TIGR00153 family)
MRHTERALRSIRNLFVIGEKRAFQDLAKIINIASEANTIVGRIIMEDDKGEAMVELLRSVQVLEKKSDDIAFEVTEGITSGAISPNLLDALLESVDVADTIIDQYYNLSRELERMSNTELDPAHAKFKAEFDHLFETLGDLAEQAFVRLNKLLVESDMEKILVTRKAIQRLEEQGDDVKDSGFDKLYRLAPKLNYIQFIHYFELLHKFDDVLDACEDLSDLIVSIIKSVSR